MALWLSQSHFDGPTIIPNSLRRCLYHVSSATVAAIALYKASALDRSTVRCFLLLNEINESTNVMPTDGPRKSLSLALAPINWIFNCSIDGDGGTTWELTQDSLAVYKYGKEGGMGCKVKFNNLFGMYFLVWLPLPGHLWFMNLWFDYLNTHSRIGKEIPL